MQPTTVQATKKDNSEKKDNYMIGPYYCPICVIS
ncbi:hypothetical protein HG535_0G00630 [Zygotorulaspora mrakii]|uniref:Uncharacterized protein n=1 Tax=Zygotorulaspora mrakii TaxID=42260 RepID=A0A7H9B871_ZYGMR|nr:uncharacterized protein HG535_0G00630 [Zygotorulaspora mrakii]QLG74179.1 hypothetical protein HG535_0G00630 [Zygotorulaspora mrakii]